MNCDMLLPSIPGLYNGAVGRAMDAGFASNAPRKSRRQSRRPGLESNQHIASCNGAPYHSSHRGTINLRVENDSCSYLYYLYKQWASRPTSLRNIRGSRPGLPFEGSPTNNQGVPQ
jgi:hypothetical protein